MPWSEGTRDRLVAAGGLSGLVFVYSLPEGRLVRRFSTGRGGLINDVALGPAAAHMSRIPRAAWSSGCRRECFGAPAGECGGCGLSCGGATRPPGPTRTGIAAAGRRYLLVNSTATGALVRVNIATRRVRRVRVPEGALPAADGTARAERKLYGGQFDQPGDRSPAVARLAARSRRVTTHEPPASLSDNRGDRRRASAGGQLSVLRARRTLCCSSRWRPCACRRPPFPCPPRLHASG